MQRKKEEEKRLEVLDELRELLKKHGIELWCVEGENEDGTIYYEECYVTYKGETFTIDELF